MKSKIEESVLLWANNYERQTIQNNNGCTLSAVLPTVIILLAYFPYFEKK